MGKKIEHPNPEEARFDAESTLFVEGAVDKGDHFDEDILNILVGDQIAVKPLGPSYSIQKVSSHEISNRFDKFLQEMTGGKEPIEVEQGNWVNMIKGKAVLNSVINSSCFKVPPQDNRLMDDSKKTYTKVYTVIADILKDPSCTIPHDFEELKKLIRNREKPA